jgi:hypothetical protein
VKIASPAVPAATDAVRREWLRRVEAEYRSASITQHLGLWLIQIGAPPELIHDALRIVGDEMVHAELSHVVFVAAGGSGAPALARETLGLPRSRAPIEHDVLRHGVEVFCLGETIAVRLFKRLRSRCTVPEARRTLDRVLRDEVRHRDFGWTLLEWLLANPTGPELRALLGAELPGMLKRQRARYAGATLARRDRLHGTPSMSADERAWGLMPLGEYAAAVDETWARDYAPRFAALGVPLPE